MTNCATSFYFIAGEASGDNLGGKLMAALKSEMREQNLPAPLFHGVGGQKMQAQGLASLFDYSELSLMGFSEVLPHLWRLKKRMQQVEEDIVARQPDCVVTIDSPGFTFRLVRRLRAREDCKNIRFIHYVAPSVWAYKPQRAKKTADIFDMLLTLLPFEPNYFRKHGLEAHFIGHPVIEDEYLPESGRAFRERYGILPNTPLVLLLPGSRKNEIRRHLEVYRETMERLSEHYVHPMTEVIVIPKAMQAELESHLEEWPGRPIIITSGAEKPEAFAAASVALVKSGTVSLELACAKVPMVVTYKVSAFSAWLLRRMIQIKYVSLVNILLNREAIPELLQEKSQPEVLVNALYALLASPSAIKKQKHAFVQALSQLKHESGEMPSKLGAKHLLKQVQNR